MTAMMSAQQASRIIMPRLCARSCSCARRSGFSSRRLGLIGVRVSGLSSLGQGERGRGGQSIIFFRSTKHLSPRHAREAPARQQSCASRWRVCASARGLEESGYAYEHSEVRRQTAGAYRGRERPAAWWQGVSSGSLPRRNLDYAAIAHKFRRSSAFRTKTRLGMIRLGTRTRSPRRSHS